MGCCGSERSGGSCICDILKQIADAQQNIYENECHTSCDRSINELLGETEVPNGLDTVPVILYCNDGCMPFKGYGAHPRNIAQVMSSFYFRVRNVTDDCCATMELLRDPNDDNMNPHNPVEQQTGRLCATGICITVDVKCFCHMTCLPAISAF